MDLISLFLFYYAYFILYFIPDSKQDTKSVNFIIMIVVKRTTIHRLKIRYAE